MLIWHDTLPPMPHGDIAERRTTTNLHVIPVIVRRQTH